MGKPRMTLTTLLVLKSLLADDVLEPRYGLQVSRDTGLRSGTLYPILARLERTGWVSSYWEDPEFAHAIGRPSRRYYVLTAEGEPQARAAIADARKTLLALTR